MISEVVMGLEIKKHLGASSGYPVHIINKHNQFKQLECASIT